MTETKPVIDLITSIAAVQGKLTKWLINGVLEDASEEVIIIRRDKSTGIMRTKLAQFVSYVLSTGTEAFSIFDAALVKNIPKEILDKIKTVQSRGDIVDGKTKIITKHYDFNGEPFEITKDLPNPSEVLARRVAGGYCAPEEEPKEELHPAIDETAKKELEALVASEVLNYMRKAHREAQMRLKELSHEAVTSYLSSKGIADKISDSGSMPGDVAQATTEALYEPWRARIRSVLGSLYPVASLLQDPVDPVTGFHYSDFVDFAKKSTYFNEYLSGVLKNGSFRQVAGSFNCALGDAWINKCESTLKMIKEVAFPDIDDEHFKKEMELSAQSVLEVAQQSIASLSIPSAWYYTPTADEDTVEDRIAIYKKRSAEIASEKTLSYPQAISRLLCFIELHRSPFAATVESPYHKALCELLDVTGVVDPKEAQNAIQKMEKVFEQYRNGVTAYNDRNSSDAKQWLSTTFADAITDPNSPLMAVLVEFLNAVMLRDEA